MRRAERHQDLDSKRYVVNQTARGLLGQPGPGKSVKPGLGQRHRFRRLVRREDRGGFEIDGADQQRSPQVANLLELGTFWRNAVNREPQLQIRTEEVLPQNRHAGVEQVPRDADRPADFIRRVAEVNDHGRIAPTTGETITMHRGDLTDLLNAIGTASCLHGVGRYDHVVFSSQYQADTERTVGIIHGDRRLDH